jgi:hypothetical protein
MKKILMILFVLSQILFAVDAIHLKLDGNLKDEVNDYVWNKSSIVGRVSPCPDRDGNLNAAMCFNGGYIKIPYFKNILFGSELTVSVWIRRDKPRDYQGIIGNGYHTSGSFEIRMGREYGGTFLFGRTNGRTTGGFRTAFTSCSKKIEIGKWHHVVMTIADNKLKLYVDGNLVSTKSKKFGYIKRVKNDLIIGANGLKGEKFYGAIDDIRILYDVLSDDDVVQLYTGVYDKYNINFTDRYIDHANQQFHVKTDIKNLKDVDSNLTSWSTLTLPSKNILSLSLPKEISVKAYDINSVSEDIKFQPWFKDGTYIYTIYFVDKNNNIYKRNLEFVK